MIYRIELLKNTRKILGLIKNDTMIIRMNFNSDKKAVEFGKKALERTKNYFFVFVKRRRFPFSWRTIYKGGSKT